MTRFSALLGVAFMLACVPQRQTGIHDTPGPRAEALSDTLLARAQEWVDSWNERDVELMRQLHADDVAAQLYGIANGFDNTDRLLTEIRAENFWNATWSVHIVEPRVRALGADAALVAFRLVGTETAGGGAARPYSAAISLIYQQQQGVWKIVHVHESSGPPPGTQ